MTTERYAQLLIPLAAAVFIGGWILAVVSYLVIGTETCAVVPVPLVGELEACQDTTSSAVILLVVVGFVGTMCSLLLLSMHFVLRAIAENRR